MPTVAYAHPIPLQDLNLWGATSGTPTFSTSTLRTGGGNVKMICAASASTPRADVQHGAGKRVTVDSFYYRATTTPAANAGIYVAVNASGNGTISHLTGNTLRGASGATTGSVTPSITTNTWYRIDVSTVVLSGVQTLTWWLNGIFQEAVQVSQVDADITASRLGVNTSTTHTAEYMDHAGSYTSGDAPLGEYKSNLYDLSTVVGANHSLGAGSYQKTGAVAITTSDANSQAELTEKPFSMTQFVAQTAIAATTYLEYPVADTAETTTPPSLVRVGLAYAGSAANAYTFEVRAYDGTTEGTDLATGLTKSGTTVRYLAATLTSPPSGGAWTLAKFNGLRLRFGFSSDVTPNPQLGALATMAVFPVMSLRSQPVIVNQAVNRSYTY